MSLTNEEFEDFKQQWKKTPIRAPKLEKVVINFALGKSGPDLERARKLAENLTNRKPTDSKAHDSQRAWGIRKGEPIGVHVTLRGQKGIEFLRRIFWAKDDKILVKSFDSFGNLAIGIKDHLNLPNVKYDPKIGVFGFGVTANLERTGFRLKRRRLKQKKIPSNHRITKKEAIAWYLNNFKELKIVKQEEQIEEYY
ncbi:MAG: 50S ribosomal protein L5 [Candidatus Heimdallarchaeota archaeon]